MLLPPLRQFGKVKRRGVSFTSKSAGVVVPRLARVAAGNVTVRTQRVPLPLSFPLNKTSPYFSLFTLEFCPLARRFAKVIYGFSGRAKRFLPRNLHGAQPQSSARISKRLPAAAAATPARRRRATGPRRQRRSPTGSGRAPRVTSARPRRRKDGRGRMSNEEHERV